MTRCLTLGLGLAIVSMTAGTVQAQQPQLGTVDFPTSATSAEAQQHFLEGVALLHSFEWEDAAEAFQRAQAIEPEFAMAYWGEALSHTGGHHFPAGQDLPAARRALQKLGDTRAERLAKTPTERERAYLSAVEQLYGPGDAQARALAYAEAMEQIHLDHPDDLEAATFYALALMRTVRRGEDSLRQDMEAGAIAQAAFRENPDHPGAAHYVIHAYDDPVHAPIALYAALKYAEIAPAAVHALHMPSHIFVQRGMWDRLARSNEASYQASVDRARLKGLPASRHSFHALYWLQYAYLQQGLHGKAQETIEEIRSVTELPEASPRLLGTLAIMESRYTIATRQWRESPGLDELIAQIESDASAVPSHAGGAVLLAAAMSAVELGDIATAERAERALGALHTWVAANRDERNVKQVAIIEKEVAGLVRLAKGQPDEAVRLLTEATAIEETMVAPSGPPGEGSTDGPIKPSHELLGEVLLSLDRPEAAAKQFATALLRMPHRPLSLLGSARAAAASGDARTAHEHYAELAERWANSDEREAHAEASRYLSTTAEP